MQRQCCQLVSIGNCESCRATGALATQTLLQRQTRVTDTDSRAPCTQRQQLADKEWLSQAYPGMGR